MYRIEKTIEEIVAPEGAHVVDPGDPVSRAVTLMRSNGAGGVLVVKDGRLVGIFTERDVLNRVAAHRLEPGTTPVSQVMTPEPEALRCTDRVTFAINKMVVGGYRHVPIVGEDGRPMAILSVSDVIEHLSDVFHEAEHRTDTEAPMGDWIDIGGGS